MRLALVLALVVVASGCGAPAEAPQATAPSAAAPRTVELDWRETHGDPGEQLVFEVQRFVVRDEGWEATVAIENRSSIPFSIGREERAERAFGLMLFRSGDVELIEELSRANRLPPLREAESFDPPLPGRLAAGGSWRGTMSAHGSLPAGLHLRIVFGRLFAQSSDVPAGLGNDLVWITDHAFRL